MNKSVFDDDAPGLYVGNAMVDVDGTQSRIGYAIDWGHQKLQVVLGVAPADGKFRLVGIKENAVVEKEVTDVMAVFSRHRENAMEPVLIGKAVKCKDGSIEVQMIGTPYPNTEIIIR